MRAKLARSRREPRYVERDKEGPQQWESLLKNEWLSSKYSLHHFVEPEFRKST